MKQYFNILLLGAIILINSCGEAGKNSEKESLPDDASLVKISKEQFSAMKMEMSALQEKEFDSVVKASGRVDVPPQCRAKVTPYVGGYVKTISLLVGDKVQKGQPLLVLESPEYIDMQRDYLEIAGQMDYFKSEYERQKTLYDEKISSQKNYQQAESGYKKAKAEYESLRQKLKMLNINPAQVEKGEFVNIVTIYAPITGDIVMINANVGMAVSPSDVIMEIVDKTSIHLELSVFEQDVFLLKKGQKIKFTFPQMKTEKFEAEISVIGTSVRENDRIINVYASLHDSVKQILLTGMFVEADLITASRNTLSVPFDAIIKEESNYFLLVFDSEKDGNYIFRKTLIKTGDRNNNEIEVIPDSNFNPDSKVLKKGVYDVM